MLYCCLPLAQALIYLKTTKREEQSLKEQSETFNYLDMEKNKIEKLSEKLISSREQGDYLFLRQILDYKQFLMHQGIEWINDSKSTTIETSAYSLEVIQKPVVWIVGANQQKQDFSLVEKLVRLKVCRIICFGNF